MQNQWNLHQLADEIRHQVTIIAGIVIAAVIVYIFALIWLINTIRKSSRKRENNAEEFDGEFEKTD